MGQELQFFVYILENPTGSFYVGHTENLARRITEHNDTAGAALGKYAPKNGPWKLVWSESHTTRSSAMKREQQIKRMKSSRWIRENLLNR